MRPLVFTALLAGCLDSGDGSLTDAITLFPTTAYTGADESGQYTVPIAASGASGMSWLSSDPTVAMVSGSDQLGNVHGVKAGMVSIAARAGTLAASAMVSVATYTTAQESAGAQSYMKFACANCHASGSDITPSGVGKHSDEQLLAATTQGANPEGGDISIGKANHSFAADPGIVAYLRSLAPEGVPHADE